MYPILIAISFILHLFAFFWIVLLSLQIKRSKEIEKRQTEIQKEIEDLFQSYLLEMKEENEKLLNMLEKSANTNVGNTMIGNQNADFPSTPKVFERKETVSIPSKLKGKLVKQAYLSQEQPQQQKAVVNAQQQEQPDYKPPTPHDDEQYEQSFHSQVFQLLEKGYHADEIAQKLNTGKTEIELLLKFRGQNQDLT